MLPQTEIYTTASEVTAALDRYLGLPLELLEAVARTWWVERLAGNRYRPRGGPGYAGWDRGTEHLRLHARAFGYVPLDDRSVPLAVSRDRGVAIQLLTGSDSAGDPTRDPTTKNARGKVGGPIALAQVSTAQMNLQGLAAQHIAPVLATWIVLPCLVPPSNNLRFEVSCAALVGPDGNVSKWWRRIVPCAVEGIAPGKRVPVPAPSDEIVIDVRQK